MYYVKKKKSSQPPKTKKKGGGVLFLGFEFGDWFLVNNLCFGLFFFGLFSTKIIAMIINRNGNNRTQQLILMLLSF